MSRCARAGPTAGCCDGGAAAGAAAVVVAFSTAGEAQNVLGGGNGAGTMANIVDDCMKGCTPGQEAASMRRPMPMPLREGKTDTDTPECDSALVLPTGLLAPGTPLEAGRAAGREGKGRLLLLLLLSVQPKDALVVLDMLKAWPMLTCQPLMGPAPGPWTPPACGRNCAATLTSPFAFTMPLGFLPPRELRSPVALIRPDARV